VLHGPTRVVLGRYGGQLTIIFSAFFEAAHGADQTRQTAELRSQIWPHKVLVIEAAVCFSAINSGCQWGLDQDTLVPAIT